MAIENAVSDLKTALDGDDKDTIDAKTAALGEASGGLAQKMYAEQAAEAGGDEGTPPADDVVDAEFEEVEKDDSDESDDKSKSE
jgi:molecular chaperone DnaK